MEINELFIGAWVMDGIKPAEVTGIICDGIVETTVNESSNIEVIEPIPLTDAILYKHGFDYHHRNLASLEYPIEETFTLAYIEDGLWRIGRNWYIRYVHELQLALRLLNVGVEIDLT